MKMMGLIPNTLKYRFSLHRKPPKYFSTMGEVDRAAFIQAIEHRPKVTTTSTTIEVEGIPVVDLSLLNSPKKEELDRLVSEIGEACSKWGFFQVINHGVPSEYRQRIESASRKFFSLSKEEKLMVKKNGVSPMGYYDTEHTRNVRDWKEVFDFAVQDDEKGMKQLINQWPKYPPELREACEEYAKEVKKLCFKLLEVICLSLGLKGDRLNEFFEEHTSFMRLNYYPPCPIPHLALGVGQHKDPGALTVLAQDDVEGLEVKRKAPEDGDWILVKPIPEAFIINVGDIIQVWSNDKYESVEHRVTVNSERERFSIPFFFNPSQNAWLEPLREMITQHNPSKYNAFNCGNFFATRQKSNLKKLDVENIQIYHFKI